MYKLPDPKTCPRCGVRAETCASRCSCGHLYLLPSTDMTATEVNEGQAQRRMTCEAAYNDLHRRFKETAEKARIYGNHGVQLPFAYVVGQREVSELLMVVEYIGYLPSLSAFSETATFEGRRLLFSYEDSIILPVWEQP